MSSLSEERSEVDSNGLRIIGKGAPDQSGTSQTRKETDGGRNLNSTSKQLFSKKDHEVRISLNSNETKGVPESSLENPPLSTDQKESRKVDEPQSNDRSISLTGTSGLSRSDHHAENYEEQGTASTNDEKLNGTPANGPIIVFEEPQPPRSIVEDSLNQNSRLNADGDADNEPIGFRWGRKVVQDVAGSPDNGTSSGVNPTGSTDIEDHRGRLNDRAATDGSIDDHLSSGKERRSRSSTGNRGSDPDSGSGNLYPGTDPTSMQSGSVVVSGVTSPKIDSTQGTGQNDAGRGGTVADRESEFIQQVDRSVVTSEMYEVVTSSVGDITYWQTDAGQDVQASILPSVADDRDRLPGPDATIPSAENGDYGHLSLEDDSMNPDNASSHDLERLDLWPVKHSAVVEGDLVLGGLMMVHEREDTVTCGPVMPQGGVQALEAMLYTLDRLNDREIVPGVKIGAHILDDCDKDTYGLEMAVDFIKASHERLCVARYFVHRIARKTLRCKISHPKHIMNEITWRDISSSDAKGLKVNLYLAMQIVQPTEAGINRHEVSLPPAKQLHRRHGTSNAKQVRDSRYGGRSRLLDSKKPQETNHPKISMHTRVEILVPRRGQGSEKWSSIYEEPGNDQSESFDLAKRVQSFVRNSRYFELPYIDERISNDDRARLRAYSNHFRFENPETHHPIRHGRRQFRSMDLNSHVQVTWPVKKEAVVEGDLVLGGLMMVHEREDTVTCGPVMPQGGVQALEAMLYTMDRLNEGEGIVPGVKIGAHILDDCDKDTYGLEMAVDFIKGSISNIDGAEYHCNKTAVRKVISGVVGAASSVTSIQVANLLRLFRIPQVSFFSTSPELSNKQRFEYFTRTIPSDHYQVKAMVDIVLTMGWSYVSIIYEESNYGIKAFEELEELLGKYDICIAIKEKLVKDSGVAEETAYDNIVLKLLTKPRARGCIIFGSDQEVAGVMRAVRRCNATGSFSWIGSDGWSARGLVSNGNEPEVEGTLSVQPQANPVRGFEEYFLNLTVENNRRNPWFVEFWEDHFQCRYPNASRTPYNQRYTKPCTTKERLTKQDTAFEDQLQFVSDAVMAFAYAFRDMHRDLCHGKPGLCDAMKPTKGIELLRYLRKVDFEGLSGDKFKFDKNGDGPARYNIIHFKQTEPGKYKWVRVGKYLEGELRLNMSEIQFKLGHPQPPESVCSLPCEVGQAKKYVEGERCCWHCFNCTQYQIRHPKDETQCIPCRQGTVPDETHSTCQDIPEEFLRPESGWAIGAMSFSASGILITFCVCGVFLKHNDTPVVRASGRELSYVLLSGILLCYLVTFALVMRPTDIVCGIQRFAAGFCFTVVYAALLTKTNRISRIFNASKHSAKRPSFISPRSQLIICSGLVFVQILINGVWMIIDPAKAMHHYPTRDDNLLVCNSYVDASYMIAFAYPIMLIVVCTVYAVLTRKIPEAFNESKHIGFTMYTTCVIWLAFVPLYFGTGSNVALRITSMSVTISLSASVTIACLFSPKLYIILIRPERNVRQSMMPARYSTTKSSAVTATNASSMIAPITLTAATCDQNKAVKKHIISTIDCSTQSEYFELEVKDQKNGKPPPAVVSRSTQTSNDDKEPNGTMGGKDAKENPTTTKETTTTKQLNNNARIGNGPVNQADVSL
ncbi:Metabotropic glutamate receptor [Dufourea novaeangliae]|uniref:Metabotropic glutamate receptor n=1 Tax=Dufourea novaeangliae TaxID=178035 RepID=A0A154PQC1_DUFNO|nr:Metabotropic glutamate receptor [Dufourea novaeangliae]